MGVSKAQGFVLADRLAGRSGRVYVITGDGELQEGQFWESLQRAANRELGEITVIVDHNKLQSDTWVDAGQRPGRPGGQGRAPSAGPSIAATATTWRPSPRRCAASTSARAGGRGSSSPTRSRAPACRSWSPTTCRTHATSLYGFHSGAPVGRRVRARAGGAARSAWTRRLEALGAAPVELATQAAEPRAAPALGEQRRTAAWRARQPTPTRWPRPRLVADTASAAASVRRSTPTWARHRPDPVPRPLPRPLLRVRDRRAGHGLPGRRDGPRRPAPRRALVRLLPHPPRQRADLQQRHRGHQGDLRRLARRARAGRARATRTSRCATSRSWARCRGWR